MNLEDTVLHEKGQAQEVIHCRVPSMWSNRIGRPTQAARTVEAARGWEEGVMGVMASWAQGLTGGDEDVVELHGGGGYITLWVYKCH